MDKEPILFVVILQFPKSYVRRSFCLLVKLIVDIVLRGKLFILGFGKFRKNNFLFRVLGFEFLLFT